MKKVMIAFCLFITVISVVGCKFHLGHYMPDEYVTEYVHDDPNLAYEDIRRSVYRGQVVVKW